MSSEVTEAHLEDLRNHFADGYSLGRADELQRILTLIELDLLTTPEVKERLKALAYGGHENVPKS
jgi:hypothetical protein